MSLRMKTGTAGLRYQRDAGISARLGSLVVGLHLLWLSKGH